MPLITRLAVTDRSAKYEEDYLQLYYFKDQYGNFGDDLNPWLWENLFPGLFNETDPDLFIGVGTLLNHRLPAAPSYTVFGSGHGYGSPPEITSDWKFYCVRGPLTAASLGLSKKLAITDPASLAPLFFRETKEKLYPVSFMPHCDSARLGDWSDVCQRAGIHFLDPRDPFLEVFGGISQSELLLTEAMHGAILADSFRVPWIPIRAYEHISEYKWQDWFQSIGIETGLSPLPSIWRGDRSSDVGTRLKNRLKQVLLKTSLWQNTWKAPPPQKSSEKLIDQAAFSLLTIQNSAPHRLSSKRIFDDNTAKLLEAAKHLKKDLCI